MNGKDIEITGRQRRILRAWCIYDWANSGYATSGGAAIFPVYFVFLFKDALGESVNLLGMTFTSSSTWSLGIVLATAFVALSSPALGVIADRVPIKKMLLWIYTSVGALFTALMFFSTYTAQPWLWFLGMFIMANIGFAGCLVFYNAFLPHIASRKELDAVSSRGFAYGYIGGGLLLLIHLGLIVMTGDSAYADLVARLAIVSVGVWWFGWALWTLLVVPEPHIPDPVRGLRPSRAVVLAFRELSHTLGQLGRFKVIVIYLISYLFFNDGIQTVIAVAGAYAADTLRIPLVFNMITILIIQFVGAGGSMIFAWIAARIGAKPALTITLIGWIATIAFGVALTPLVPSQHQDFDYRFTYQAAVNKYRLEGPTLSDSRIDQGWGAELSAAGYARLANYDAAAGSADANPSASSDAETVGVMVSVAEAERILQLVATSELGPYGASVSGGPLDQATALGQLHSSNLADGLLDWWPELVRRLLWAPLGLEVEYQWLILGVSVGLVMGGSQALARSCFARITPQTRSGEFFSFFGFIGRVSAVLGPIMYVVATGIFESRVAIASIMILIIIGVIVLRWVDIASGAEAADAEDARHYALAAADGEPPPPAKD